MTGDVTLNVGQTAKFGRLVVRLDSCRYPTGNPASDSEAHLTIVEDATQAELFNGWMLASSPALSALDDPRHAAFTEEVKLEPFARALRETAPQVWFTALRATDTAVRAQMDAVSVNPDGLIKVAPLLHWSSKELYQYCEINGLPNNFDYVDPTKGEDNRECGLHLAH